MPDKHLSSRFDADLTLLSTRLLEMGGLVESQIAHESRRCTHPTWTLSSVCSRANAASM